MSGIINAGTYKVHVDNNIFFQLEKFLNSQYRYSKKIILVDEITQGECLSALLQNVPALQDASVVVIEAGEKSKSLSTCEKIWSHFTNLQTDRRTLLINLGGGVVCDVGGFAASVFLRGIDFVNIPTSLLAMVDSSVGGKTGINFSGLKNQVGTFRKPVGVFITPLWLKTLPEREMKSGFAEIVKHVLISSREEWNVLKTISALDTIDWIQFIRESVSLKNEIVSADFHDRNKRKTLNFGHTIGHALESYSLKHDTDPLRHGEAIALGLVGELYLSQALLNFSSVEFSLVVSFIAQHYNYLDVQFDKSEIMKLMQSDKKNENSKINFVLLRDIGDPVINQIASGEVIFEALDFVEKFKQNTTLQS